MKIVFWLALAVVAFTYLGYPMMMAAIAAIRPRPLRRDPQTPTIDVVLVVHNAADYLEAKLTNLAELDYPGDQLRINVVCDGCSDRTESIAREFRGADVRVFAYSDRRGKSACIGAVLPCLDAEMLMFTDVRQRLDGNAARALAATLADPHVGAVSGELTLQADSGYGRGVDAYWRYEKMVRRMESASGSLVGVTGALYAVRRNAIDPVPPGIVLDDMWIPLRIASRGLRVVFEPSAIAYDSASADPIAEERRKRRTLAGNYQLLHRWPQLALPGAHPLAWRLWGHKWLRLLAPWLLLAILLSNLALAAGGSRFYLWLLLLQIVGYALAAIGRFSAVAARLAPVRLATAFLSLNASALLALLDYMRNSSDVHLWQATRPGDVRS
ncbi:MAG TPA: glycosyltransferase family 2 protein [Pseudoxanthomonas sp.]